MPSCQLCSFKGEILVSHISSKHHITSTEYKQQFPNSDLVSIRIKTVLLETAKKKRLDTTKIKKAAIERSQRKEYLKNLSDSHKGKKQSEETKKKLSKLSTEIWNNRTEEQRIIIGRKISEKLRETPIMRNTKPERKLQEKLRQQQIFFLTHQPIYGLPDIVIPTPNNKILIFVDGCYWHGCFLHRTKEGKFKEERTKKDKSITETLRNKGYVVIRIWEHDIIDNIDNVFEQFIKPFIKLPS